MEQVSLLRCISTEKNLHYITQDFHLLMKQLLDNNNVFHVGIVTRRPLVLQLHRIDEGKEYAEFMHLPKKKFSDFGIFPVLEA